MDRLELTAWLRLTLSDGIGNTTARRLLAAFGLPQQIFLQDAAALSPHATPAQVQALGTQPEGLDALVQTTLAWLDAGAATAAGTPARRVLTLGDAGYPAALLETADPPLLLYLTGPEHLVWNAAGPFPAQRCLAMVGSRNPTAQGEENARQFARALRAVGLCIVSGLALGVDAAAHEGALADLPDALPGAGTPGGAAAEPATIAVVGTGLDRVYPRRNLDLARRIAQHGLLVSEYPLGTPPLAGNFPKRNRIIAGLSQGTLVVEAALASGSLITARLASEQGREVFAIPGSIHAPQSRGCHALIRQGAKLVESAQDVLEELPLLPAVAAAPAAAVPPGEAPQPPAAGAGSAHGSLLQALGFDPVGLDALVARTGLGAAALQAALLELELDGHVARLPGGLFQRVGRA